MQLNPARGRKHVTHFQTFEPLRKGVYAAQPREGTETGNFVRGKVDQLYLVYAAQPREGTETLPRVARAALWLSKVYAAQPREGTETLSLRFLGIMVIGLCSSTPRGDGNKRAWFGIRLKFFSRFMQLNPARGRKP